MAFKEGDLVRLKSGGPLMTVDFIQEGKVWCDWFNQGPDGWKIASHAFKPEQLERATG